MTKEAEKYLNENNINPSYQRVKIMEYLLTNNNHPTIETIYSVLKKSISKLSKTTIYNTLKIFIDNNVVTPVYIEENTVRYDVVKKLHGHFKCNNCGKIQDIDLDFTYIDLSVLKNIEITEHHINFKGKCNNC